MFPTAMKGAAREIIGIFPGVKQEVEEFFRWPLLNPPSIVIKTDKAAGKGVVAENFVIGYAVPSKLLIVIFYSRIKSSPRDLRVTLKHELCHLILHEHVRRVKIPRWFDEGISQVVSGVAGEVPGPQDTSVARLAHQAGGLIGFKFLTDGFPRVQIRIALAYAESRSFVNYIIHNFGQQSIYSVLDDMKNGITIERALLAATGSNLHTLELKWRSNIKETDTWMARLSYYLYEILFALASLVSIYVFLRRLRAKRAYMDEDQDYEGT